VYYRARVRISRGRPNETSRIQPQTCAFQVNNRDGRFSPRNPNGAYYGLIGRNTQVRVSRLQNGVRRYRFHGEVVSWPTTWEISGSDVWVDVTAAGMLRRLQQGASPIGSAMTRAIPGQPSLVAYWPCEDGVAATTVASAVGGPAMSVNGVTGFAAFSGFPGTQPIPTLRADQWSGTVPVYTSNGYGEVKFLLSVPTGNTIPDLSRLLSIRTQGSIVRIDVLYRTGGTLQLRTYNSAGTLVTDNNLGLVDIDGLSIIVVAEWQPSGSDTNLELYLYQLGSSGANSTGVITAVGQNVGTVGTVVVNPDGLAAGASLGQIFVQAFPISNPNGPISSILGPLAAFGVTPFTGENPQTRFTRLCSEQGVNGVVLDISTLGSDGTTMGNQYSDTFPNLIQQTADTGSAMVYEAADQLALVHRTRLSLYDQGTAYNTVRRGLSLDFAQHQFSGPLDPVDDDANTRNDVTVQRISGSSGQASLGVGALSTRVAPNGVGDYASSYPLSIGLDASIPDHAHWRLHLGTVDEPRYPQIMLNLRHPQFTGNTDLLNQALVLDIGDLVAVNNPPAWMPPDQIRQILQGYSETLGVFEHDMVLNCSPEAPYRVGVLEDKVLSRADTDGSALAAPLGPALNANPFFAGGSLSEWSVFAGSIAAAGTSGSPNPLPPGGPTGYGALLTPDGSLSNCALSGGSTPGFYIPVAPGGTYQVSALVYSPGGYGNVELGFDFYDAAQSYITTSSVLNSVTAGAWTALSTSQAAGGTAAFMRPRVGEKSSPTAANTLYVAAVVAWQGAVSVASTNTLLPLWTTSAGAFPFDVGVSPLGSGGERMTVTGIAGGASPQVFTVARGVNGTIVPQPAGADVRLWQPCTVSL
jgi:hypothetical protein